MDRRSRSPDSPDNRRYRRRRRSRSYSRSRSRDRSRDRRHKYSRERNYRYGGGGNGAANQEMYTGMDQDYQNDRDTGSYSRHNNRSNDRNERRGRRDKDQYYHRGRGHSSDSSNDSFNSEQMNKEHFRNQVPSNKIIILGLAKHLTEADINSDLFQCGIQPVSIRLIRKRKTGASRGFAFVEFSTEEEATRWMEYKQGLLVIQDQYRAVMQYSVSKESLMKDRIATDWYCAKCGVFNFKRRDNCFKCNASREESEKGGEGSDEVSSILTKKIMLRNLDVLTNEEGVLTVMQEVVPNFVSKISKILICRDPLTSTSRGICYLSFDNLVDSMNTHNALKSLEPPLTMDSREILITYCVDMENRQINARHTGGKSYHDDNYGGKTGAGHQYTLADVPRLAEYSAGVYAKTTAEHEQYFKYYTDYYVEQINKKQFSNLPTMSQIGDTANSGAAVALSAMQRKQKQQYNQSTPNVVATPQVLQPPNGTDNKKYPTPDISQYQYEESSGFYYDPSTGLYYDSNSQYYYNSEIASYLYWDQEKSTYLLANQADNTTLPDTVTSNAATEEQSTSYTAPAVSTNNDTEPKKNEPKHDKIKVAKKIVKDMEKWAKQLNQKKDMNTLQVTQMISTKEEELPIFVRQQQQQQQQQQPQRLAAGYADVGFSIMENRDVLAGNILDNHVPIASQHKVVPTYTSDSDSEQLEHQSNNELSEKDYIDFDQLTCLLCKRAFQSIEQLNKHLKLSNLHKENLQKHNLLQNDASNGAANNKLNLSYRDRAKERRLKYGESDPPPINKSRERFEKELQKHSVNLQKQASKTLATRPIDESNVGNRLLQKMGWTEGQGLGRANQGRTNIIEAESRAPAAGLGSKNATFIAGDDYRTYIKRMMKSRYEQAD